MAESRCRVTSTQRLFSLDGSVQRVVMGVNVVAETRTELTADFYDRTTGEQSRRAFMEFRSHLVSSVENGDFPQIKEANVYREPSPDGTIITVKLIVSDPISTSVQQADKLLENSATLARIRILVADEKSGDAFDNHEPMSSYESDGMTLIPA